MKKVFLFLAAIMLCSVMYAQSTFTVVYADSYDGFVSIRQTPSSKAKVLGRLNSMTYGLGDGILLGQQGNWSKVKVGNTVGWCYSKYVGKINWVSGKGKNILVAAKANVPIYGESYDGESDHGDVFARVNKGTIIADTYSVDGAYYVLETAHSTLLVRKSDVVVKRH